MEKPIYDFISLRRYLESRGIHVKPTKGPYTPIEPGDVILDPNAPGRYEFRSDGIFFIDEFGDEHQVYLYKRQYHLGYGKPPRMHIRECSTILSYKQMKSLKIEYRRANTSKVPVKDMDSNYREVYITDLPLCLNCQEILRREGSKIINNSTEFVELLKETEGIDDTPIDVDILGYTKDWEKISRWYREKHDWTCERCGLHITNPWDRHFMQVHHKNGRKADNRESNLECLCIRCHSQVNQAHRENFSHGDNKLRLDDFNDKYPLKSQSQNQFESKVNEDFDDLPF